MNFIRTTLFLIIFAICSISTRTFAQSDTVIVPQNNEQKSDSIRIDLNRIYRSSKAIYTMVKQVKNSYKSIVDEHKSLFTIEDNYFNAGFLQQGLKTFEIGLSHGKRELLSIARFQEIHFNLQITPKLKQTTSPFLGFNVGISKSNLFFNRALEAQYVTNFNGEHGFIFRPEIGISFLSGSLNINYGYNFMFRKMDGFGSNVLHIRYTKQNFKQKIKEKIIEIKTILEKDRARLKALGIQLPRIDLVH